MVGVRVAVVLTAVTASEALVVLYCSVTVCDNPSPAITSQSVTCRVSVASVAVGRFVVSVKIPPTESLIANRVETGAVRHPTAAVPMIISFQPVGITTVYDKLVPSMLTYDVDVLL